MRKECDDLHAQVSRQSDKNNALQADVTSLQATVRELQEANVKLTTDLTSRTIAFVVEAEGREGGVGGASGSFGEGEGEG